MKMSKRLFIIMAVMILSAAVIFNCSDRGDFGGEGSILSILGGSSSIPSDPLNDRTNPLQTYIRANWTNGDENATGGLHYDHIKVAGFNWYDMGNLSNGADQAEFVVDHFDLYVWGGSIVGEHASGQYQDFIWLLITPGPYISSAWDSTETVSWLSDSTKNTEGYTWEDLTMHFKYDDTNVYGNYQGWNPDDDMDGDGCRDSTEASDSMRTAECVADAEIFCNEPLSGRPWWNFTKLLTDGFLQMICDRSLETRDAQSYDALGYFHDCNAFNENINIGFQNSFTYENNEILTANRDYYLDLLLYVATLEADYLLETEERSIHIENMVSPYYTCATSSPAKDWAFEYIENMQLECWIMTDCYGFNPLTMNLRPHYLDCPFEDWMEEGKGIVFCCKEDSPGSDRGRIFTLSAFYMINHQMAFYCYVFNNNWMNPGGEHVSEWNWNPYVEYDVGQPAVNTLGLEDFQGNSGTDRYFVWEEDDDYEILGREYLRSDSLHVLVLTKIMAQGKTEGSDPTSHELPKCYQEVQSDLNLGPCTREITLCNNDGAILVATSHCSAPPVAEFSASPTSVIVSLIVDFTDLSTNFPTSWEWDFGDGNGSLLQNPQHTYSEEGTYTVSLTATNDDGSDTETKYSYITVNAGSGGGKGDPFQQ